MNAQEKRIEEVRRQVLGGEGGTAGPAALDPRPNVPLFADGEECDRCRSNEVSPEQFVKDGAIANRFRCDSCGNRWTK